MLLAQLEGLAAVAARGSVSRAASDLGISQPALSARLHSLERELGVTLLARSARGVRLTDAGRALLPYSARVIETAAEAARAMARLRAGGAALIEIGAAPAVGTYVLPRALAQLRTEHPDTQITVRTGHSEEVLELVLGERVHVGLVRDLRHPLIEVVPLYEDELALVVHPAHPFARRGAIGVEELSSEELVLFDRSSSYHDVTSAFLRDAGVRPLGVMELDNIDAAKRMVAHALGVALLPRTAVADEVARRALAIVPLRNAAPLRRRIVAIRRADAGAPSALVASFLRVLVDVAKAKRAA